MQVGMLGAVRLATEDGRSVPVGGVRLRMLLARLALDPGRFVAVGTLIDDLWGEQPPADAANALQSLVSRLRKVLRDATGAADLVPSGPAGYRLAVDADDVDAIRFERLVAEGRNRLRAAEYADAAAVLAEADRLWHGTALADVADAPFAGPVVARLTEARLAATEDRCAAELMLGRHVDVLPTLDRLAAEHPLRERSVALRMRALAAAGRTADALAEFQRVRGALADELGVDPSAELQAAHMEVLRGPQEPRQQPSHHVHLPAPLTSFVGRDAELADAAGLLAQRRLVSLVGAGGAGKTRLALELARSQPRVWFVELAAVREGAGLAAVASALLSFLDIRDVRPLESGPRDPIERLAEEFSGGPGLLVLDNCEHVIAGAAALVDRLLRRCAALSVLATSREPLAITGEVVYRVGPLDLPGEQAPLAEAKTAPSVRLFLDRAGAASPGFALDDTNLAPVTEICRRLDGMPLALELAAARLRAMTARQVAALLDDRFRLLTVGDRASLPRQRTLRGVVEWSWELLTEAEQTLAMRLATLAGGADEDSAVGVCADAGLPADDVPYLMASLVEKSLLTVFDGPAGRARYRMLETVRAYGLRELAASGDGVSAAFIRYFTDFVTRVEPTLRTGEQLESFRLLGAEHDNVIAALDRAVGTGDGESAARLVCGMAWYWMLAGDGEEAMIWAKAASGLPAEDSPAVACVRLAMLLGEFQGDVPTPEFDALWDRAVRAGVLERYPMVNIIEAVVRMRDNDMPGARAAATRMANSDETWSRAAGKLVYCLLNVFAGEVANVESDLRAALADFRAIGDRWGTTFTLGILGQAQMARGDLAGGVRLHEEAVRIAAELGGRTVPSMQLVQLATARGMADDIDGAERDARSALATMDNGDGDLRQLGMSVLILVAVERGDLAVARKLAGEAEAASQRRDDRFGPLVEAKVAIALAAGELVDAGELLSVSFQASLREAGTGNAPGVGERIAELVARRGAYRDATVLLGAAGRIRGATDLGKPYVRRLIAELTERLGEDDYQTAYAHGFDRPREQAIEALRVAVRAPSGHPAAVGVQGQGEEHRDHADQPRQ